MNITVKPMSRTTYLRHLMYLHVTKNSLLPMRRTAVDGDGFAALDMARWIMVDPDHSLVLLDPDYVIIACPCD
jgi:hypothetical protein